MIITQKIKQAIHDANKAHGKLKQEYGKLDFIVHPVEVMCVLVEHGEGEEDILCGAILHDIIEDTDWNYDRIWNEYGSSIADLVAAVTDDMRLPRNEQLKAQLENMKKKSIAQMEIKIADRIANLRPSPGKRAPNAKRIEHSEQLVAAAKQRMKQLGEYSNNHPLASMLTTLTQIIKSLQ